MNSSEIVKIKVTITPGTIGAGIKVHYLYGEKVAICGAGQQSTGARRRSTHSKSSQNVTCERCLKIISSFQKPSEYFEYTIKDGSK